MAIIRHAAVVAVVSLSLPAAAMDFKLGDEIEGKLNATVTAGTMIRTESPDSSVLGALSAVRVGLPPGQLGGNSGRNDLNFQKNRPVSTVLKGVVDLELKRQDFGFFVRAKAWNDFELKDGNRAYGNSVNGFQQNVPLSDNGFDPAAKFSNFQLTDAYVFGRLKTGGDATLDLRAGRQVVHWGVAQFVAGGIDAVNPTDYAARVRPGALAQEITVPVGMLYANLASGREWEADGFVQYEFRPSVLAPCGTFFDSTYYAPVGCNYASVLGSSGVNDASAIAKGLYPKRNPDVTASDSGQYGLSLRYAAAGLNTDFRGYAMNYHSRMPSIRGTNPNVAGGYGSLAPFSRLTDPNGLKYAMIYPEGIRLYGLSFDTKLDPTLRVYGEIAYRPNQPVNLNLSDLISAFLGRSPNSALNLAKNTNAIAPGGTFDGYDRFKVTTTILGTSKAFPTAWGAERLTLSGELGWSHVAALPDSSILRYGRSDDYGIAAVNGIACVDTTPAQKSCANDGFVTSNAWGYRIRLAAEYPGAFFGATVTPSLAFAHDVSGYSYDGSFLKDRKILRPGIRADWDKQYFADIQYARISGGAYNTQIDRDNVTLVVGVHF